MSLLNRLMPLMFFIIVAVTLFQFFSAHPITPHGLKEFFTACASGLIRNWLYIIVFATLLWIIIVAAVIHEHRSREGHCGCQQIVSYWQPMMS